MRTNIIKSVIFFLLSIFTLNAYADEEIIKWVKLTNYDNIPEGEYVIAGRIGSDDTKWYSLANTVITSGDVPSHRLLPLSDDKNLIINGAEDNEIWEIIPVQDSEGFYYIKHEDNYLQNTQTVNSTIEPFTSKSGVDTKRQWKIHYYVEANHYTGYVLYSKPTGNSDMHLGCTNTTNHYWKAYTKTDSNTSLNNTEVVLYQKIQGYERTDGLAADKLGTICLPYNVEAEDRKGAEFYSIAYKDGNNLILYQETGTLVAGKPYIFVASSDKITFTYSGERADEASNNNGLYGSYDVVSSFGDLATSENIYIIHENSIQKADNTNGIPANRAYIKMSEVPTSAPAAKQGKIMTLGADGYIINNGTTGITSHTINSKPTNTYNLSGQKVSSTYKGITIKNGRKSLQ